MTTTRLNRCSWCGPDELYIKCHDTEWGRQVTDDKILFEFLILESAQAGLSWITILRRREGYRKLFAEFDVQKVAKFTETDVNRLVLDPAIIRHRGKIEAAIQNARIFIQIQQEFGSFYNYLYQFLPNNTRIENHRNSIKDVPVVSDEAIAIAKDLKKRGMIFLAAQYAMRICKQWEWSTITLIIVTLEISVLKSLLYRYLSSF